MARYQPGARVVVVAENLFTRELLHEARLRGPVLTVVRQVSDGVDMYGKPMPHYELSDGRIAPETHLVDAAE